MRAHSEEMVCEGRKISCSWKAEPLFLVVGEEEKSEES
jgi:hypothetical protein